MLTPQQVERTANCYSDDMEEKIVDDRETENDNDDNFDYQFWT